MKRSDRWGLTVGFVMLVAWMLAIVLELIT